MDLHWSGTLEVPLARVEEVLVDVAGWGEWVPGLVDLHVGARRDDRREVLLVFEGPRVVRLRADHVQLDGGIDLEMVEGDLLELHGRVRLEPDEQGTRVRWSARLHPGIGVPGPLMRELEHHLLPAWHQALSDRVGPGG